MIRLAWPVVVLMILSAPSVLVDPVLNTVLFLGIDLTEEMGLGAELLFFGLPIAFVMLYLGWLFLFLRWTLYSARNARALGATDLRTPPGWAVGWYFVPILQLWKPYLALRDIWRAALAPGHWREVTLPPVFGWWWGLSAATLVIGGATGVLAGRYEGTTAYAFIALTDLGILLLDAVVILLTAVVVRRVARAQMATHSSAVFR